MYHINRSISQGSCSPENPACPAVQHHDVLELLGAIEPPARLRPRDRLTLGLMANSDGVKGVDGLCDAALTSVAGGDTSAAVRCLVALSLLCVEQECSERLGAIGGHKSILRLMAEGGHAPPAADANRSSTKSHAAIDGRAGDLHAPEDGAVGVDDREPLEGDEDEVQAAAALVAARVVASGCAFPMRASLEGSAFGRFPLQYEFVIRENTAESALVNGANADTEMAERFIDSAKIGSKHIAQEETPPGNRDASLSVLVRPVKERQQSQFDVGFQMWPAAIILSRWLCRNPDVLRGRRVLEVGSGLGLAGLVAAHIADDVTLSDFNPAVLRVLEANAALNAGWSEAQDGTVHPCNIDNCHDGVNAGRVAIDTPGKVSVRHLDWDKLQAPEMITPSCSQGPAEVPGPLACDGERSASVVAECGEGGREFERVEHGERFEVIIASDHICQVRSDSNRGEMGLDARRSW